MITLPTNPWTKLFWEPDVLPPQLQSIWGVSGSGDTSLFRLATFFFEVYNVWLPKRSSFRRRSFGFASKTARQNGDFSWFKWLFALNFTISFFQMFYKMLCSWVGVVFWVQLWVCWFLLLWGVLGPDSPRSSWTNSTIEIFFAVPRGRALALWGGLP